MNDPAQSINETVIPPTFLVAVAVSVPSLPAGPLSADMNDPNAFLAANLDK
jgi:hypothetical protein